MGKVKKKLKKKKRKEIDKTICCISEIGKNMGSIIFCSNMAECLT